MDDSIRPDSSSGYRLPRRELLRAGAWAGLGLAGFAALACSPGRQTPSTSPQTGGAAATGPAATPKTGGTLVLPEAIKIISLDPHKAAQAIERIVHGPVYNGLLRYKAPPDAAPNSVIEPELAESWKQIDDTTYEFKLRPGVNFHKVAPVNGRELVADDIKLNLERVSSNKPGFLFSALYPIASVSVVDKYTARVKTIEANAPFLGYIAFPYANIAPFELWKDDDTLPTKTAIGTGPFVLKKFDPNTEAIMEKNPEYFRKGLPYLDGIRMAVVPDRTSAYNAFRGRQVDITPILGSGYINAEQAEIIKREMPQATVFLTQMLPWPSLRFNTAVKPYGDKRVRQAFSYMTDRDQLIAKTWAGNAKIIGPLPSELKTWALPEATLRAHPLYKRDVANAKQLLSEAGVTGTLKVKLVSGNTTSDQMAVLKQQWAEAGVDADVQLTADSAATYSIMEKGEFDLVYFGHSGYQDPDDYFSTYVASDGPRNYGKFSNKEIDDLIVKQRRTVNEAERQKIVTDIQMKILEESPCVYLNSTPAHLAAQPYVKNLWVNPIAYGATRYWDTVWLDK